MSRNAVISSDCVEVELLGRCYGTTETLEQQFKQQVPESLRVLAIDLKQQSKLLALKATPALNKHAIYEAYRHDLNLLNGRVNDLERCVERAIRCSITVRSKEVTDVGTEATRVWDSLKQKLPPIGRRALLKLDHQLAGTDSEIILTNLQQQFGQSVDHLLRLFTFWLQLLVENEFVGLVEWTAEDVCRYHYFCHRPTAQVQSTTKRREDVGDGAHYREVKDQEVRHQQFLERHVHHVVEARLHSLEEYPEPVPERVRDFLNEVPGWLRPLLQIVEGHLTFKQMLSRKVADTTVVETTEEGVYRYDPAVCIGDFALVGWSADDLTSQATTYYRQQKTGKVSVKQTGWAIAAVVGLVALVAGVIWYFMAQNYAAAAADYNAYVETVQAQPIFEAKKGDSLNLGGEEVPICFAGQNSHMARQITLTRRGETALGKMPLVRNFNLPNAGYGYKYGDVDLGQEFGVFAKLHIVEASGNSIKYAVTYYGEGKK